MIILETERLRLRQMSTDDADFILELLNESSFIRYIGDKGVRTLEDARQYILTGPVESYKVHGFGLYLVELKATAIPIGMSGLLKRDTLPHPDIGFAFLPAYWKKGYALESAAAVMKYARDVLSLGTILAITSPGNEPSERLLGKIGLVFQKQLKLSEDSDAVNVFSSDLKNA